MLFLNNFFLVFLGKKIVPTLKIKFAKPLFHQHEDGREEDGKGPIVKMSEGNIDPKILNGRSLETKRSTRPFKIVCKFQKFCEKSDSSNA